MPVTIEDVKKMAVLARLDIAPETQELFARQFGDILNYMDTLAQVDTQDVAPLYSPAQHATPVRQDVAEQHCQREAVLGNAPCREELTHDADNACQQYFVVPRIV